MRILACVGSYRKNGNTARLLSLIEEQMRRDAETAGVPFEFETVYLGHHDIQMCRGCRICFDRGEDHCPLKDDLLAIKAKMQAADGVIIATPVYVSDVSGITKNWIDRLAHVCHRPEFAGKCAYLLVTVGAGPTSHALTTLNIALRTWGFHILGQARFKTGALMEGDEIQARYHRQAGQIADRVFNGVLSRQFMRPSFLSVMTFHIQQKAWQKEAGDTVDYRYWTSHGWVDPERTFYTTQNASWIKVALARLVGAAIAPFVS